MRRYGAVLLIAAAAVGGTAATSTIRKQNPPTHPVRTREHINKDEWPAVDYDSPAEQKKPDKATSKLGKGRYEGSLMMVNPLDESEASTIMHGDAYLLPALPVAQSDVVLVGLVTDAKSYLSADKTGVYSEFTVQVGKVLKGESESRVTPGISLTVQRAGGRVRFPSGRSHLYSVANERMPQPGRRYLLFLTRYKEDQTLHILTGYELTSGVVTPLDDHQQFSGLKGKDEVSLLDKVSALTSASQN